MLIYIWLVVEHLLYAAALITAAALISLIFNLHMFLKQGEKYRYFKDE